MEVERGQTEASKKANVKIRLLMPRFWYSEANDDSLDGDAPIPTTDTRRIDQDTIQLLDAHTPRVRPLSLYFCLSNGIGIGEREL